MRGLRSRDSPQKMTLRNESIQLRKRSPTGTELLTSRTDPGSLQVASGEQVMQHKLKPQMLSIAGREKLENDHFTLDSFVSCLTSLFF